jgi:hypothetical protein
MKRLSQIILLMVFVCTFNLSCSGDKKNAGSGPDFSSFQPFPANGITIPKNRVTALRWITYQDGTLVRSPEDSNFNPANVVPDDNIQMYADVYFSDNQNYMGLAAHLQGEEADIAADGYLWNVLISTVLAGASSPNDSLIAGKTYYWKVIVTSSMGLVDDSGIMKFTVSPAEVTNVTVNSNAGNIASYIEVTVPVNAQDDNNVAETYYTDLYIGTNPADVESSSTPIAVNREPCALVAGPPMTCIFRFDFNDMPAGTITYGKGIVYYVKIVTKVATDQTLYTTSEVKKLDVFDKLLQWSATGENINFNIYAYNPATLAEYMQGFYMQTTGAIQGDLGNPAPSLVFNNIGENIQTWGTYVPYNSATLKFDFYTAYNFTAGNVTSLVIHMDNSDIPSTYDPGGYAYTAPSANWNLLQGLCVAVKSYADDPTTPALSYDPVYKLYAYSIKDDNQVDSDPVTAGLNPDGDANPDIEEYDLLGAGVNLMVNTWYTLTVTVTCNAISMPNGATAPTGTYALTGTYKISSVPGEGTSFSGSPVFVDTRQIYNATTTGARLYFNKINRFRITSATNNNVYIDNLSYTIKDIGYVR